MQFATQFAYDPMYIAPVQHRIPDALSESCLRTAEGARHEDRRRGLSPRPAQQGLRPLPRQHALRRSACQLCGRSRRVRERQRSSSTRPSTSTQPPAPRKLSELAGYGNSPLVHYPGAGAYFLDRLEPGVWRLEVMPDAIWVRDPFEKPSPEKAGRTHCLERVADAHRPSGSRCRLCRDRDSTTATASSATQTGPRSKCDPASISSLVEGVTTKWNRDEHWNNITLKEFVAPEASVDRTYVLHRRSSKRRRGAASHHGRRRGAASTARRSSWSPILRRYANPRPRRQNPRHECSPAVTTVLDSAASIPVVLSSSK